MSDTKKESTDDDKVMVPSKNHEAIGIIGTELDNLLQKLVRRYIPEEYQCIAALDILISLMAHTISQVTIKGHEKEAYDHVIESLQSVYAYKHLGIHAPNMIVHGEKPEVLQ